MRALCFTYESDAPRNEESVPAWLPDHALVRQGDVASLARCVGSTVPGSLFQSSASELAAHGAREGVPGSPHRVTARVLTENGRAHDAQMYLAQKPVPVASDECAPSPDALFVYGTLMQGQPRHDLLERFGPRSIEAAQVRGRLVEVDWYPGLIVEESGFVHGELVYFERLDALFAELDPYEDFAGYDATDSLYFRGLLRAKTQTRDALCWSYVFVGSTDGLRVVESGDWRVR